MPICWIQGVHTSEVTFSSGEIIGGHESKPHSRPYMAYLQYVAQGEWKICGGFLIREDFVLTAAHCLGWKQPRPSWRHSRDIPDSFSMLAQKDWARHKLHRSAKAYIQEQSHTSDGLTFLVENELLAKVKPGKVCLVAGWGRLAPNGKYPNTLQEVELTLQEDQVCKNHFRIYNSNIEICAGDPKKNKDPFQGDSGGPLVCNHVAQGIVSYTYNNGTPPSVYTKVSRFLQWIKETMKSHQLQETD
uniref:Granzyme B-like n=1 Tax=Ictidomys tridecemlineatus TaxID=43179 RepID=I3MWL6_ICTTR